MGKSLNFFVEHKGGYEKVGGGSSSGCGVDHVFAHIGRSVIHVRVTSDDRPIDRVIADIEHNSSVLDEVTKDVMSKAASTTGVEYDLVVLGLYELAPGWVVENRDHWRMFHQIAKELGYSTPKAEAAYLLAEKLTAEDLEAMGFKRLIVMHTRIIADNGEEYKLATSGDGKLESFLVRCFGGDDFQEGDGLVFLVPKTKD